MADDISVKLAVDGEATFNSAMKALDAQLKSLDAGMKAAVASMAGMGDAEAGAQQKTELLTQKVEANQQKLSILAQQYDSAKEKLAKLADEMEKAKREHGETSEEATKATNAFNNQSVAVSKIEKDMNSANAAMKTAQNELDGVSKKSDDAKTSTEKLSEGFKSVMDSVSNLISNGLSKLGDGLKNAFSSIAESGMSFESTMSKVKAVSGATGEEMDALTAKAKEMGASTVFSASESAEAFTYMAMAGWDAGQMVDGIEGIMNLAAASGEDLATTSDIVTDALTAMGYAASDAGQLADVMAAASSSANTNVSMMGETFKYAAPLIGAMGYSMEDAAVAIGLMANAGVKGSQAGTALRSTISRLAAPTEEVEITMAEFGLSLTDASGKMKPFRQLMQEMREAFRDCDPEVQAYVSSTIAGKNAMSGFLAIINASDEDFNKMTEAVDNSSGAAKEMAETMNDNVAGALTIFQSATSAFGQEIYEKFQEPVKKAIQIVTEAVARMTDKFKAWAETDEATALFDGIAESITTVATNLADYLPAAFDGFMNTLGSLGDTITSVGETVGWLVGHAGELVEMVKTAITVFVGLKTAMMVSTVIDTAKKSVEAFKTAQAALNVVLSANPIGIVVAAIAGLVTTLVTAYNTSETFRTFVNNLWDTVKSVFAGIKDAVQTVMYAVVLAFSDAIEAIKSAWSSVASFFASIWSGIQSAFSTVVSFFTSAFTSAWNGIKSAWNTVTSFFASIWSGIQSAFSTVASFFSSAFTSAWNGIKSAFSSVTSYFQNIWSQIKNIFSNAASTFTTIGKNIVQGIWDGINSMVSWIKGKISGFTDSIVGGFKNLLGIHSPSRVMRDQIGVMMGRGVAEGIEESAKAVQQAFSSIIPDGPDITASIDYDPYNKRTPQFTGTQQTDGQSGAAAATRPATIVLQLNDRELARATLPAFEAEQGRAWQHRLMVQPV